MNKRKFVIIGLLFLTACTAGFRRIKGNGHLVSQFRTVAAFSELSAEGAIDVLLEQGDVYKVEVIAEENLQAYIEVVANGNQLTVRDQRGVTLKPTKKMQVHIIAPSLRSIEVSGATDVKGQGKFLNNGPLRMQVSGAANLELIVDAPALTAKVSGSGDLTLEGDTRDWEVDISGAGNAHCYELRSENASVEISGAGHAELFASKNIDADVSGAGSLKYKGHPAATQVKKSGAGDIQAVE